MASRTMTASRLIMLILLAAAVLAPTAAPLRADDAAPPAPTGVVLAPPLVAMTPTVADPSPTPIATDADAASLPTVLAPTIIVSPPVGAASVDDVAVAASAPSRVFLPLVVGPPPDPLRQLELDFIRLLNEERQRRGVQIVVEDPRFSEYARIEHARFVAERIRALGLVQGCQHRDLGQRGAPRRWLVIGEALACGNLSAQRALEGLLNSPPHRGIITHPDADQIGVGVAEIRPGAYVFSIWPAFTPFSRERIEQMTLDALNRERANLGGQPFIVNPKLARAARRIAERIAAGPRVDGFLRGCIIDDPRPDADAEGYAGQTARRYIPRCFYHLYPSDMADYLYGQYRNATFYEGDTFRWDNLYAPRWRAIGVGAARPIVDPWMKVDSSGNRLTDDVVVVVIAGDDPEG